MAILRECRVVKVVSEENKFESIKTNTGLKKVVTNELSVEDKNHSVPEVSNLKVTWDRI